MIHHKDARSSWGSTMTSTNVDDDVDLDVDLDSSVELDGSEAIRGRLTTPLRLHGDSGTKHPSAGGADRGAALDRRHGPLSLHDAPPASAPRRDDLTSRSRSR